MLSSWTCITPVRNLRVSKISNKVKVTLLQKLLSSYVYDLITDWGHFKDHRCHFKLAKRCDKQRTIPSCIKFSLSEPKKVSVRLQNNKFSLKKIRLKALLTMKKCIFCTKTTHLKILKAKDQLQASQPSHDSDYLARLATFNNWSMRGSSFKQIKLSKLNH